MPKRLTSWISAAMMAILFLTPVLAFGGNNLPKTQINNILSYKSGLQLTESQIKKLTIIDRTIVDKMIQVKAQAEIRKSEIDVFMSNWSNTNTININRTIKEYYKSIAKLKELELEALIKARQILTNNQLKKYSELVSVETMMLKLDSELAISH
ncbi:MAG: hypothetical protein J7K40_02890 [candidate division Zixibacteria bacterium]|nr:hypothetical protein [candidate division Zixibacteria bacterium]